MSQVLGVSVTDLEVASVVADARSGEVLARNFVELPSSHPDVVFDAIFRLVQSAPSLPGAITIACADSATTVALGDIIDSGRLPAHLRSLQSDSEDAASIPDWFARTTVVGSPVAYAQVASAIFGASGVVLVADLDSSGALFPGQSVALVDTNTRSVVGASEISGVGARPPVTDPDGAQLVGDAMGVIPGATGALQGIAVIGPGAGVPGVAPSLEYALQLPVQVSVDGQYAAAYGAALVATATTGGSVNNRWVLLSAATAAALLVAIGVITAVVMTGNSGEPRTVVEENSSTSEFSTPTTTTTTTTTKSTPRTTKSTPTPEPTTTEVPTQTQEPTTITIIPEPTTITQTPSPSPSPSETTTTTPSDTPSSSSETTPSPSGSAGASSPLVP